MFVDIRNYKRVFQNDFYNIERENQYLREKKRD